jgi:hypothetical protein
MSYATSIQRRKARARRFFAGQGMRDDMIDWLLPQVDERTLMDLVDADELYNGPMPEDELKTSLQRKIEAAMEKKNPYGAAFIEPGYEPHIENGRIMFLSDKDGACYEPIAIEHLGQRAPTYVPGRRIA